MLPEKVHGTVGNHRQGEPQFLIEQAQEKGIRLIPTSYSTNWRINTMKPSFFCSAPLSASSAIPFVISNGVMFVRLTSASKAQAFFFFFFCVHVLLLFGLYALRVLHYSTILFSIMGQGMTCCPKINPGVSAVCLCRGASETAFLFCLVPQLYYSTCLLFYCNPWVWLVNDPISQHAMEVTLMPLVASF